MKISGILKPLKDIKPVTEFLKLLDHLSTSTPPQGLVSCVNKKEDSSDGDEEPVANLRLTNKLLSYHVSKFETVLDNLNDGIMILDSSGRVLAMNHIMEQLLNLKRGDIKGRHIRECQGGNGILGFVLEHSESIDKLVEKTADINVGASYLRVSYKTLIRGDGHPNGSLLIAKDITSQKLSDQAKMEFLSHVSHELKTPLNTIKAYTEMLVGGEVTGRDTIVEFCNTMNEEAGRLSTLINNLLHLSKIEMGGLVLSRSMTRTKEFIEGIFKVATSQKKKNINYELILPEKLPPVNIDKEFMGIVLMNLIGNAIKYTPEHGKIILRVDEEVDKLMIHVIDNGIGISEADMPHIFDKFYRSSDAQVRHKTGHGLGLSIAKQIVELHDGEIRVISKKGEGSQFSVILPVEEGYFLE